ncbi:hypothetical protein GCM10029992_52990 [Glycomyces albus]
MATEQEIAAVVDRVKVKRRREDAARLVEIMRGATGVEPEIWPGNIIGFGSYHYRYESGREGDTVKVGFAPRAQALTLYGLIRRYGEGSEEFENRDLMDRLGTYTTGKGCLYIKYLDDVDIEALMELIRIGYRVD